MEVSLTQILDARERRVSRQQACLAQGGTLLCFTLNIAGPVKDSPLIRAGFHLGANALEDQLASAGIRILHKESYEEPTGCEGYYVLDGNPVTIKTLTVQLEDGSPVGRLYDMDVMTVAGKLGREALGLPGRTCLLCGNPVHICSSRRAHSLEALQDKTQALLREAVDAADARQIGALASRSVLFEVAATPKPGLVDRRNNGSHTDMDIFTFLSSAAALGPYFTDCALLGRQTAALSCPEVFSRLRLLGRQAEQTMFRATGGVNTHKGAIFCLGLLCAAAGRLPQAQRTPEAICREAAKLCDGITGELTAPTANPTAGQRLYAAYGVTGVRGEAEKGFPTVLNAGLPALEAALAQGYSLNDAACWALLAIIAQGGDTNLMARGGFDTAREIAAQTARLLQQTPVPTAQVLETMDDAFISQNLSPGGSADLLACTLFLHFSRRLNTLL